jgi:cation diffusion facilitator family transporter
MPHDHDHGHGPDHAHDHDHGSGHGHAHGHGRGHGGLGMPGKLSPADARRINARVTTLSVSVAAFLSAAKLAVVIASGSVAILASLADSALDLLASLGTFFAVRYAAEPADAKHRYGHGKAEAFAALFQAGVVTLSAALLGQEAVVRLLHPAPIEHGGLALGVMVVSIAVTAGLLWAQTRAVQATGSVAVHGDRLHYASDLASNVAVILGVLGALAGLVWADAAAAGGIALWLLWGAWGVARGAVDQMMDRELPESERDAIRQLALKDPRVLAVHQLRTRAAGPLVHIQFHVDIEPTLTLEAAHVIMVAAEERILAAYPGADVMIHPDPAGWVEPHGAAHFRSEAEG